MNNIHACLALCSLLMLHGCFDSSDNTTKDNSSGTRSSVQMQEGKADKSQ